MEFKTISFEEYKKIETMLLTSVEDLKEEVYKDSKNIASIGIGINIESNNKLWHYLILYHIFGLTKDLKDIPLKMIDTKLAIQKQTVRQFTENESYKNNEYEILIDNIVERYKKEEARKLTEEELKEYLNQNIKDAILSYLKQTQQMQNKNPKANLKELQRLSEEDLKINKNEAKNPKYLEFKLSKKQAKELLSIMMINYELNTLRILKNNQELSQFEYKKEEDRKWYKELIPFVSATYNSQNYIKQNSLLKKAWNVYESRFFIWAIIRYDFIIDAKRKEAAKWKMFATRMLKQACIFNFNQKLDKEKESDEEKFKTCIDIFKVLNLIHPHTKQTYFSYFKKQDKIMLNNINDIKTEYDNKNAKNYINDEKYEIYRLGYINSNELQALNNILNPYVYLLDELIPCAKFENNQDFTRYKLLYYDNKLKEKESALKSRFKPENIYIIDKSNFNESLRAINSYKNTQKTKENILILIIETIDTTIKINRANNTYLYLVSVKNNHFDCSFINNPLNENTIENDKTELFLCELEDKPKIISLATKALQMQQDNDKLSAKYNNINYTFNPLNHLTIDKEREKIFVLSNYYFYLQKRHNDKGFCHILNTTLKPNQLYSTLGIELISPKEQDSFHNDGNFTIYLNHIHLNQIENETNHTITKDTPIFAYVQENKQNFITKLQDKTLSFRINIHQILTKDERGKNELIDTKNIFLSYIPFQNNEEANNTSSQKLQLDVKDLEKGSKSINYKIPYAKLEESKVYKEWEEI